MNYFNGDGYGNGCAFLFIAIFGVFLYGFGELAIWIAKPREFIVTKDMIPTKRIVTDGIKVDTVLVYKFNK